MAMFNTSAGSFCHFFVKLKLKMINDYKDSFKFDQKTEGDLNFLTFTFLNPDKAFT